ncbi:hypothetical protein [Anabaena sphaerica]|nr:hypothetical protein [Anabaena sphaerica]
MTTAQLSRLLPYFMGDLEKYLNLLEQALLKLPETIKHPEVMSR